MNIRSVVRRQLLACAGCLWAIGQAAAMAAAPSDTTWQGELAGGLHARELGNLDDSLVLLRQAANHAADVADRVHALTELGVTLTQAGRLTEADSTLQSAYREADSRLRYVIALALGNETLRANDRVQAGRYYQEAVASAPNTAAGDHTKVTAELNLTQLEPALERLGKLELLLPRVEAMAAPFRAHALFSIGEQASEALEPAQLIHSLEFNRALRIGYRGLKSSLDLAQASGDVALEVDAGDALAQLYESQGRLEEAERINQRAIVDAGRLKQGQLDLPLARLEWRAARLAQQRGESGPALASYLRATRHLNVLHQDLPIEDARGRSTYQTLQHPIYLAATDLLLTELDKLTPEAQQQHLRAALDLTEQAHQAELQDYLGDRCSSESLRTEEDTSVAPGVALVYPIIFKNRLEVIVRTSAELLHHTARVPAAALASEIQQFRAALLDPGSNEFAEPAQQLEQWLIAPFSEPLARSAVHTLVIVPDGYLRLIPFGALRDSTGFLAQRYAISTMTGLTMTELGSARRAKRVSLFAGLSTPGPVVDRLLAMGFNGGAEPFGSTGNRQLPAPEGLAPPGAPSAEPAATRELNLRNQLALPGVQREIDDLTPLTRSAWLMNDQFTVGRFTREVQSGRYGVVHIASHSFFGGNSGQSFLLAYDNVIKIDDLQQLIAANDAQQGGIDLLTLSACDTSTGDDRAPLGFAGAAIRAHARSVLGTLWAVNDTATQHFMEAFYRSLPRQSKGQAITDAQRALIGSSDFSHPYYWAAFVLTGDWN